MKNKDLDSSVFGGGDHDGEQPSPEMVERGGRAVFYWVGPDETAPSWEAATDETRRLCSEMARAVIIAAIFPANVASGKDTGGVTDK